MLRKTKIVNGGVLSCIYQYEKQHIKAPRAQFGLKMDKSKVSQTI